MNFSNLLRTIPVIAVASCAAPKAIVVEEALPEPVLKGPPAVAQEESQPPELPDLQNDGLRLPNLLDLPGDEELRAGVSDKPARGSGAVISRPPTDPPSRPKPDDAKPPENP